MGQCEILDDVTSGLPQIGDGLHKIRDLAASAAAMLHAGECEIEAVARVLELEGALSLTLPRKSPAEVKELDPRARKTTAI